ncbi:MarR family winged helix-turn-helix transcriptional regulator [Chelatococcus asaccharovorans]|uniref:DNA-binding MarR family transcriptional regulator n=1 Tax=Chelatococcus asaccharovorans TaxID=28210 RepID=A0A2V3UHN3_9HYPH|nr:MarR family winged helix-turn-helix transcriptional regulator [Chelatococcus asaccharovorans]MBS7706674.1 winged helix-turn-helix transcriptional regulator [Chelatococcus asaccharovorans]PXW64676.1 DNA-binding MarR family transcriptional regulator [Chelatococcus asaccharovorans]CAH1663929.1 DNA-binding MarR family transcriptional regulator [Chelatococcus asaccharovorans]CAH1682591.1 DNA-binding MarR family transcriptional regulator [Chelatococcus asaccharovorans]
MTDVPPTEPPFHRAKWPFYWIARVTGRYFQTMETALEPIGIDVPSYRVLMTLYEDHHVSVSAIADACVIKLSTATRIVQRMTADGLVVTRPSPRDRRVTEVSLTAKGETLRHQVKAIAESVLAQAFEGVSDAEREALNSLLAGVFGRLKG